MRIPGFTADAAVYRSCGQYRAGRHGVAPGRAVVRPQGRRSNRNGGGDIPWWCAPECKNSCGSYCVTHADEPHCRTCIAGCVTDCAAESGGA